ncbi:MAG: hypothetical protein JWL81_3180 [Verrucomicrobiales bacterium]|nr:hypothetical protein [Verrucomicrobiales bacterium]
MTSAPEISLRVRARWLPLVLLSFPLHAAALPAQEAAAVGAPVEFFEKKVRPLLAEKCYSCHSADTKPSGGLRVDDRRGLLEGGKTGPALVVGNPDNSLLVQRLRHADESKRMPKESDALTDSEVEVLTTWIRDGAAWPAERIPSGIGRVRPEIEALKMSHWAWQPLKNPTAPEVRDAAWAKSDVDRFVLSGLEKEGLSPVADADRTTLIRRLTFDLTGLPPSPVEIDQFLNDTRPGAIDTAVDRLLDSPAFGEQWARHWLDLARYGESSGPSRNIPYPHAWKYRDYVIDAVQRDVPYNRFIGEQIAGDLLSAGDPASRDRLLTATGFLALGVKDVNQRFKERFIMDNVDEQIDVVSRAVIGLTVSCARCHDHKFDPIGMKDYYALAGIFTSTEDCAGVRNKMGGAGLDYYDPSTLVRLTSPVPAADPAQTAKLQAEVADAKKAWDAIRGTPEGLAKAADGRPAQRPYRLRFEKLQGELQALTDPAARGHAVHGVRESKVIADTELRVRGEAERRGPAIGRGFISTFPVPGVEPIPAGESGRRQLVQWLVSPQNPLTARVAVNRIWAHLFGRGLVSTVDNFGVKGDAPSHPELLDRLATDFINGGWSVKKSIRALVLTRAYQLGAEAVPANVEKDPDNRLVWRHAPRRLSAEELRDSILSGTGRLLPRPAEGSAAATLKMVEMRDNGQEAKGIHTAADTARHRSLYLPLLRGVIPKSLEAFDPVTQSLVTGKRDATTVPTQALFMLNAAFVREQSLAYGAALARDKERSPAQLVAQAYRLILGRLPTEAETARALTFLTDYAADFQSGSSGAGESAGSQAVLAKAEGDAGGETTSAVVNPDDVDRTDALGPDAAVQAGDAATAAWMGFVQALFASAEFRYVR